MCEKDYDEDHVKFVDTVTRRCLDRTMLWPLNLYVHYRQFVDGEEAMLEEKIYISRGKVSAHECKGTCIQRLYFEVIRN